MQRFPRERAGHRRLLARCGRRSAASSGGSSTSAALGDVLRLPSRAPTVTRWGFRSAAALDQPSRRGSAAARDPGGAVGQSWLAALDGVGAGARGHRGALPGRRLVSQGRRSGAATRAHPGAAQGRRHHPRQDRRRQDPGREQARHRRPSRRRHRGAGAPCRLQRRSARHLRPARRRAASVAVDPAAPALHEVFGVGAQPVRRRRHGPAPGRPRLGQPVALSRIATSTASIARA